MLVGFVVLGLGTHRATAWPNAFIGSERSGTAVERTARDVVSKTAPPMQFVERSP